MIRRYKKNADPFDTLEVDYDKDPDSGVEKINKITVFDNTTGKPRLIGYINRDNAFDNIYKIEAFSKGHDIEDGYEGPTAIYYYNLSTDPSAAFDIECRFEYLRSTTKKYVEGFVKINSNEEKTIVIDAKLYDLDGINVTDEISYDETREIYTLNQYENDGTGVYKLLLNGEYTKDKVEVGNFKIYDLVTSEVIADIDTVTRDTLESLI